jgi:hypothetical protein
MVKTESFADGDGVYEMYRIFMRNEKWPRLLQ